METFGQVVARSSANSPAAAVGIEILLGNEQR
jgi:hypothetical protein